MPKDLEITSRYSMGLIIKQKSLTIEYKKGLVFKTKDLHFFPSFGPHSNKAL